MDCIKCGTENIGYANCPYCTITDLRAEINRLNGELEELKETCRKQADEYFKQSAELERVSRDAQIATDTRGETYSMLTTRAEKAERERDDAILWFDNEQTEHRDTLEDLSIERTSHEETKRALELACERIHDNDMPYKLLNPYVLGTSKSAYFLSQAKKETSTASDYCETCGAMKGYCICKGGK